MQNSIAPVVHSFDGFVIEERTELAMERRLDFALKALDEARDSSIRVIDAAVGDEDIEGFAGRGHVRGLICLSIVLCPSTPLHPCSRSETARRRSNSIRLHSE